MSCKETVQSELFMDSAVAASNYIKRMIEKERKGTSRESALDRLERRYGIPYWTMNNLRIGRAKTVEAGLFARIKAAYLDLCERELSKLQTEIEIARAITNDDSFEDLRLEAEDLVARVAAKREALK